MGKFDQRGGDRGRGGFGGGRGGFGGGRGGRDGGRPEMFRATCAECGSSCEVPFKPSGDRPVLCSACFSASKGEKPRERSFDSKFGKGGFNDKPSFSASKPSADISKLENEIKAINEKLDRILNSLSSASAKSSEVKEKSVVKPVAEKKVAAKTEVKKTKVKAVKKPAAKAKKK